jgi:hypothetical protein
VVGVLASLFLLWRNLVSKPSEELSQMDRVAIIMQAIDQVTKWWELGDYQGQLGPENKSCKEFVWSDNYPKEWQSCNPHFLQCIFEGKWSIDPVIKIDYKGQNYKVEVIPYNETQVLFSDQQRFYRTIFPKVNGQYQGKEAGIQLKLGISGEKSHHWTVQLLDQCHDSYLPQKIYPYKVSNNLKPKKRVKITHHWDNWGRDIFIDKFLVKNINVIDWKLAKGKKLSKKEMNSLLWYRPSTDLSFDDQKQYCLDRGKVLLKKSVHLAISAHQGNTRKSLDKKTLVGKFGLSGKSSHSLIKPFSRRNQGEKLSDSQLDALCSTYFTQECLGLRDSFLIWNTPNWSGIFQLFGGPLESISNDFDSEYNLAASSYHFDRYSKEHTLGQYLAWNLELGDKMIVFNQRRSKIKFSQPTVDMGFRCQKEYFDDSK